MVRNLREIMIWLFWRLHYSTAILTFTSRVTSMVPFCSPCILVQSRKKRVKEKKELEERRRRFQERQQANVTKKVALQKAQTESAAQRRLRRGCDRRAGDAMDRTATFGWRSRGVGRARTSERTGA